MPRSCAYALERLDPVERALAHRVQPVLHARAGRGRLAAPVLAGEQPVREREVREDPDAVREAGGRELAFDRAVEERVAVLRADVAAGAGVAGERVGVGDLPGSEVRRPDVADLALADELVERGEGLLERRHAVRLRGTGTGRSSRSGAAAATLRPRAGCSAVTRGRPSPVRWRRPCPCRTSSRARSRPGGPSSTSPSSVSLPPLLP